MEADLVDALGEPDEAKELREWALGVAETYLDAAALDRVHRRGRCCSRSRAASTRR